MKKLFFKSIIYIVLIVLSLELYVRVFHLTKDYPSRYIDDYNVERWRSDQKGFSVTGNRRQNFSEFHINSKGFNSYREFEPTKEKRELALVGDSFIEGFHQDYYNSIGKKIEDIIQGIDVYEYGYAGYDFADQLHMMYKYKADFDLIDNIVIGLKFEDDLTRGEYAIVQHRLKLESPLYKNLRKIKLLTYLKSIGALDPVISLPKKLITFLKRNKKQEKKFSEAEKLKLQDNRNKTYYENFINLVSKYGYDKQKCVLLLDKEITPPFFIAYLEREQYKYIDFSEALKNASKPTTLIYDQHWNNHGRDLIAKLISKSLN